MIQSSHNPGLYRLALLTTVATFPLIFMGGLVTSHGAGMSVPDWPNSYGYNMFLFPPRLWVGGILYEHTHRLMACLVGMLSIALCAWAWYVEPRRWVRWLATAVLGAVIVQGVLGGLRVVMVALNLAVVHACVAQAFFCLAALTAIVTSRWWQTAPDLSRSEDGAARFRLIALALACVVAIYAQLIAGALMRHYQAGLAITDLPLTYGSAVPPISEKGLIQVNDLRAWKLHLPPVTLQQIWLHFAHRLGAIVVSIAIIALSWHVLRRHDRNDLRRPAAVLVALLIAQLTLGVLTVLLKKPADVASAHVAVGALTLLTAFVLLVRAIRLYGCRGTGFQPVSCHVRHGLEARATKPSPGYQDQPAELVA